MATRPTPWLGEVSCPLFVDPPPDFRLDLPEGVTMGQMLKNTV